MVHRAEELGVAPGPDPGCSIGGDVGRVERSERQAEGAPARIGLAALRGVARHAVGSLGEVLALGQIIRAGEFRRNTDRRGPDIGRQVHLRPSGERERRRKDQHAPGDNADDQNGRTQ